MKADFEKRGAEPVKCRYLNEDPGDGNFSVVEIFFRPITEENNS